MVSRPFISFHMSAVFRLLRFPCGSETPGSSCQSLNPVALTLTPALPFTAVLLDMLVSRSCFILTASTSLPSAVIGHPSPHCHLNEHCFVLLNLSVVPHPVDHCLLPAPLGCSALCFSLCCPPFFSWLIYVQPSHYWCFIGVLLGRWLPHNTHTRKPHQCISFPKA